MHFKCTFKGFCLRVLFVFKGFVCFSMKVCHVGSREEGSSPVELGEEDQRSEFTIIPET